MKIQTSVTYNNVNTDTGGDVRIYSNENEAQGSNIDVAIQDEWTVRTVISLAF